MWTLHDVSSFMFCKRKFFLEVTKNNVKSSIFYKYEILHSSLRLTNKLDEGIVKTIKSPVPYKRIHNLYLASYRRALQEALIKNNELIRKGNLSIIDCSKWVWSKMNYFVSLKAKNTYNSMIELGVGGNELWWNLNPRITLSSKISDEELGISLVIDRIDKFTKSAVPTIYCHNEPPINGVWFSDKIRLAICIMLLAKNGFIIHHGMLIYDSGREEKIVLSSELEQKARLIISEMNKISKEEIPERTTHKQKCKNCKFKEECYPENSSVIN